MRFFIPLLLLICFSLTGCGIFQKQAEPEEPEQTKPEPRYIGQITSVHAAQNFVLIRRSPGIDLSPGTILISTGLDGKAANLRVSGETLGQMLAADIQSGFPQVGDSVCESLIGEEKQEPDFGGIQP